MRTKGRRAIGWTGAALFALTLALPLTGRTQTEGQTAETFKAGGPVPYGEYLKRTGQRAPGARPKPKPKPVAVKPATATAAMPVPAGTPKPPAPPSIPTRAATAPVANGSGAQRSTAAAPSTPQTVTRAPIPAPTAPPTPPAAGPVPGPAGSRLPETAPSTPAPAPAGARLAPTAPIPSAELEAFIDGGVRQAMAGGRVAGVSVVVVQDGQVALEKGYGLARLNPAAPVDPQRTLFRLGSVSKVLTWIEVLKQVDAGRLSLDAPIDDALPPEAKLGLEGFAEPVRLRHLMTHTAGFEARELGRLFKSDPARLKGLAQGLQRERSRRVREAGRLTSYSNYGAALAGLATAAVSKAPFVQVMDDDLLGPAGLSSTTFREPYAAQADRPAPMAKAMADRLADGLRRTDGSWRVQPFAYGSDFAPAISASATPHDMGRLMTLLLAAPGAAPGVAPTGPVPWSPRVTAALFTPLPSPTPGLPGWTHGLQQETLAGGFAGFGHGGATPSFRARMLLVPQLRLGVFVVANSDAGQGLVDSLPSALAARFYGPPPQMGVAGGAIDGGRYAGLYLTTRRAYHGLEGMVDRLARAERVEVGADGRLIVRDVGGEARSFLPAGADRFASPDGTRTIAFSADPKRPGDRARLLTDPERAEGAVRESWIHQPATLAGTTIVAVGVSLLCLAGLAMRDWRDFRQTRGQALAGAVQAVTAGAWLLAVTGFLIFRHGAKDAAALMLRWPSPWLVAASWAAVAAALMGLVQLVQLRDVWADSRRVQGWSTGRRLGHTATTAVFLAYALVLAAWGALEPWSS